MNLTYDYVMEAIDKIVHSFEDDTEGCCITRTRLSPASTEDNEIYLQVEEEVETYLDGLNIMNKVELVEGFDNPGITIWILCISFYVDNQLGTYNVPVYAY